MAAIDFKVTKNCGQCGRPMHLWQDSSGSGWMHDSLADEYRCWPPARDEDEDTNVRRRRDALMMIRWRGMSRAGIAQTGQSVELPAVVAERLWSRGYKWLRIEDAVTGTELGGITFNEGRLIWWAQS